MTPVDDPSNADERYDRARVRKALATVDWLDPAAAARSAAALAEAEEAIGWTVERLLAERCRLGGEEAMLRGDGLPAELRRRLVERCLRHVDPAAHPRGEEIGRLLGRLAAGGGGTLGAVRCDVAADGAWRFRPAPPRRGN